VRKARFGARELKPSNELTPPGGTKVNFEAAVVFARKIVVAKKPIMLSSHRGMKANVDYGWLIIEERWYPA
jgi:hypothetical protein